MQRQGVGKGRPFNREGPIRQGTVRRPLGEHKLWYPDQIFEITRKVAGVGNVFTDVQDLLKARWSTL